MEAFDRKEAGDVIDLIENWQRILYEKHGLHFVHASDEWYLLAGRELPEAQRYDGYLQLENGVGMLRLLEEQVREALADRAGDDRTVSLSFATGKLAYPVIYFAIWRGFGKNFPMFDTKATRSEMIFLENRSLYPVFLRVRIWQDS